MDREITASFQDREVFARERTVCVRVEVVIFNLLRQSSGRLVSLQLGEG
jgi:hypothetical protein